ncbi:hypothetical protein GGH96_004535 [Coemansia sp. RSA 1972]|nr:hypothetical protein GGH96_004535 [Coemansia sp. RSA 1972]
MRSTGLAVVAVLASTASAAPQYGPQGMGYGYPMGGPMMGPYNNMNGMNNMNMNGPMYPPNSGYHNGRMRGQRYHAHAGVDEWPMPANPYMGARSHGRFANPAFYANNAMDDSMRPAHNREPSGEDDFSDSDDDEKKDKKDDDKKDKDSSADGSSADTQVAGVNRAVGDARRMSELGLDSTSNTSLDMAALGSKVINIDAFEGASMKSTATATATASATGSSGGAASTVSAAPRHTLTRALPANSAPTAAAKPQTVKSQAAKPQATKSQAPKAQAAQATKPQAVKSQAPKAQAAKVGAATTPHQPSVRTAEHACTTHSDCTAANPKPTAKPAAAKPPAPKPAACPSQPPNRNAVKPSTHPQAAPTHTSPSVALTKNAAHGPATLVRTPMQQFHEPHDESHMESHMEPHVESHMEPHAAKNTQSAHPALTHTPTKHEPSMKNIRGM